MTMLLGPPRQVLPVLTADGSVVGSVFIPIKIEVADALGPDGEAQIDVVPGEARVSIDLDHEDCPNDVTVPAFVALDDGLTLIGEFYCCARCEPQPRA